MAAGSTTATGQLKDEHKVILRMLRIVEVASEKLENGEKVSPSVFRDAIDFIRTFADKCHHGKEQDTLFPMLGRRGFPMQGGPIAVMLMEHDQGRDYVGKLAAAVDRYEGSDKAAENAIVENARGYVGLLRDHIHKEDNILYPMGDKVLTGDDNISLLVEFERIEKQVIGAGKHDYYLQMISKLEKEFGISGGEMEHVHH